jgi:hypothetical protein
LREAAGGNIYADLGRPWATARGGLVMKQQRYKIILVDGTETVHQGTPSIAEIQVIIGCDGLDTVTIDGRKQTVMFIDDTGMLDGKPINPKATALYHARCLPGNPYSIHGHYRSLSCVC